MNEKKLILFTREGCCLCQGLEERLRNLSLDRLDPLLELYVRDIEGADVSDLERASYAMEVPVLLLELNHPVRRFELPRVSPRLVEADLFRWLEKVIQERI